MVITLVTWIGLFSGKVPLSILPQLRVAGSHATAGIVDSPLRLVLQACAAILPANYPGAYPAQGKDVCL